MSACITAQVTIVPDFLLVSSDIDMTLDRLTLILSLKASRQLTINSKQSRESW